MIPIIFIVLDFFNTIYKKSNIDWLIVFWLIGSVMDTLLWIFRKCAGGEVGVENPLAQTGFTEGMVAFVLALQVYPFLSLLKTQFKKKYHKNKYFFTLFFFQPIFSLEEKKIILLVRSLWISDMYIFVVFRRD